MADTTMSNHLPQCLPIRYFEEVINWKPGYDELAVSKSKLLPRVALDNHAPKTLVCHDMKGGYLEDRFVQGCCEADAYRFYHWQYVQDFIYFSHHFVTIPPPSFTNAAHKHGVRMLGTVITEWEPGKKKCHQIIESKEISHLFADKLVQIADYYGFDGWLINIENPVQKDKVDILCDFVQYLTDSCHKAITNSKIIWYDSVIKTGELKWQDQLNEKNKLFFDACDSIFLNYNWNDKKLAKSKALAGENARSGDVYVGIDVFGRGCLGGGGYNTIEALEAIRKQGMSSAIFAPGWVYETQSKENFCENQDKFWSMLHQHLPIQHLSNLYMPLSTCFCQGYGQKYYVLGKVVRDEPWHNMTCQELQPMVLNEQFGQDKTKSLSITTEDAFLGGGSLKLKVLGNSPQDWARFKLFKTSITVSGPCIISLKYKLKENAQNISVALKLQEETNDGMILNKSDACEIQTLEETIPRLKHYALKETVAGWTCRYFYLKSDSIPIGDISIELSWLDHKISNDLEVLIGQLQIVPVENITGKVCIEDVTMSNEALNRKTEVEADSPSDVTVFKLRWKCTAEESVKYYNVYINGVSLGPSTHCLYEIPDVDAWHKREDGSVESQVLIQPVLHTGFVEPFDICSTHTVSLQI